MGTLLERPYSWCVAAIAINVLWSVLFWIVFFVGISWHLLQVPMGLGGAVYPVFFLVPVILGSAAYQLILARLRRDRLARTRHVLLWSLWIPFALIAVGLVVFCPMDGPDSYLGYVWSELW
jgi:hypothetical protein